MYSRIFQLSKKPLVREDYISEDMFYDGFVGTIADYVSSDVDRKYDIEWFKEFLEPYGAKVCEKAEQVYFPKGFKASYFKERYEEFKELAEKTSFEVFAGLSNDTLSLYKLTSVIESKYGFYVVVHGYPESLDDFIRYMDDEDATYYIGATIDYHY